MTAYSYADGDACFVKVPRQETDLRHLDVQFFQYNILPTILLLLMISGLINGGLSTAREWESRTVKELLLSPVSRGAIIAGKVFAGFFITFFLGKLVLFLYYVVCCALLAGITWLGRCFYIGFHSFISDGLCLV